VLEASTARRDEMRTAEVIGSLCLATDLAIGLPFEHGLQSTLVASRLADRLGVDVEEATQAYYGCLLFYAGCTTDAEISAALFPDGALLEHFNPVMFGSSTQTLRGILRALSDPDRTRPVRAVQSVIRFPGAARGHQQHVVAMCEVAEMLSERLSMPGSVRSLFRGFTARWDGKGTPGGVGGEELPLALRIIHVSRDATLQQLIGGRDYAVRVIRERAGRAFDPKVVAALLADGGEAITFGETGSLWEEVLRAEPTRLLLTGEDVDRALAAIGDFADLMSPYFHGHSSGVAKLAGDAAARLGMVPDQVVAVRRAALVHDLGRVAISVSVWNKHGELTADDWERIRLHAYHTERVLAPSAALADLASIAGTHHERLDGSGYHRGLPGAMVAMPARVLAAADAYRTMTEQRPHRPARPPQAAREALADAANAGRMDPDAVGAVLEAAGQAAPNMARPSGLTERETQVIAMVARGLQTKQIGHRLDISAKTADHHLQNAYAKIGISTRAAAAMFAMQHGLIAWGELPIPHATPRS
jgi:HD-GYP domain-containing protein (c-di-GMP phosphodiesterase class II)